MTDFAFPAPVHCPKAPERTPTARVRLWGGVLAALISVPVATACGPATPANVEIQPAKAETSEPAVPPVPPVPPVPSVEQQHSDAPHLQAAYQHSGERRQHVAHKAKLGTGSAIEDERNTMEVFRAMAPATVFVTQKRTIRNRIFAAPETVEAGTGTGFIWDRQGHIVTNAHVVGDTNSRGVARNASFEVKTFDGKTYEATLVGFAAEKDIAVLSIDAKGQRLTPIKLPARHLELEVGQKTLAIGNPFGLDHTLTTGVVSALGREVRGFGNRIIRDMIQTDASINPGNSGGPLLDSAGQLIGMNTMIYSQSGSSAGIGFAVPYSTIRRLVPQIISFGRPRRVGLGIEIVPDHITRQLGDKGVIIRKVQPQSPAAKAGLRSVREDRRTGRVYYDLIVELGGQKIEKYDDLYAALDTRKPGETVEVVVLRGSKKVRVKVKLVDLDSHLQRTRPGPGPRRDRR